MLTLVLDTNAALDLFVFGDPRCAPLRAALAAGRARLVTNAACRAEFARVLSYPALALDGAAIARAQAAFDAHCEICVDTRAAVLPRCRDPDDQVFLELARDANAALLLTRDAELLRLARTTRRAPGFDIVTPEAADLR